MTEISQMTATQLRAALAGGQVSAREATTHFLDRITELNPVLGSFITITADSAMESAAAADERRGSVLRAGDPLPALHGMPLAYKDLLDVAGVPTSYGTAAMEPAPAESDDPLVALLSAAGAISLGKTQVPEFGLSSHSENLIGAPARNPLDPSRSAGGSSGGSAGAVASGMLPVGPGNDGGGSVRIPASACGLIGLKPGLGTVPTDVREGRTDAFGAPKLTVSGPLAHTAADAALLLDAMVGDQQEGYLAALGERELDALKGLRIGISLASPFASTYPIPLAPEAHRALAVGTARLGAAGHHTEEAALHYDPRYPEVFSTIWTAGLGSAPLPPGGAGKLTTLARSFRERALSRPQQANFEAATVLRDIAADFRTQWGRYDLLLTPAMATLPPPVGHYLAHDADTDYMLQCQYTPFTSMVNVAGLPALVIPTLRTAAGLSMGVQLIGREGSESLLLAVAAQMERM